MGKGLISIIIPVYNTEKYLKECVESVLAQTYKKIEIILIDDGSTDNSYNICKKLSVNNKEYSIKIIHIENSGVSKARNIGIKHAKGEYLCFLDSDDYLDDDYLEIMFNTLNKGKVDIVFSNYKIDYGNKKVIKTQRLPRGIYENQGLMNISIDDGTITGILFGSACTALYKKRIIEEYQIKFPEKIKVNEDGIFNLLILKCCDCIEIVEYAGYNYRQVRKEEKRTFKWNEQFEKATSYIEKKFGDYDDFNQQLLNRKVSVFFWNIVTIEYANDSIEQLSKLLKEYVYKKDIILAYSTLNKKNISVYKQILINMVLKEHYSLFIFCIKYLVPVLKKILKH